MEKINEAIKRFLSISSGYGSGDGSGYGSGDGYGDGYGYGYGYGDGDGLISYNGQKVYYVDGLPTVIERVQGNLAKGYIVFEDLRTEKCYIAKHGNLFVHGDTAKSAEKALRDKVFGTMDVEEKIEAFLEEFDLECKYAAKVFYDWHHKLTGSCEFGRNAFVKNHGIDLENGMYTVKEFIEITRDDFGGEIIKQLEERINE